jgi:hypothetical protein
MKWTLLVLVLLLGCDKKKDIVGIGKFRVDMTMSKANGRCDPTELPDGRKGTWCYGQPKVGIGGQNADVDLYFLGNTPAAPVIEIQFQIAGCKDEEILSWLKTNFGAPVEDRGTKVFWEKKSLYIVAELGPRCLVRLLPKSEQAEYERLTKA